MKIVLEEYGEVFMAIVGAVGVIGISMLLLYNEFASQVVYIANGL